jgi:hypothetical protein
MTTVRRKSTPSAEGQPGQTSQPAWRQPPPKKRAEIRRNLEVIQRVSVPYDGTSIRWLPRINIKLRWQQWTALALLAGAAIGVGLLLTTDMFTVISDQSQVRGNQRVSADSIYASTDIDQRNIFLVRPAVAEARIEDMPGIASATVHLRLPAQVIIDVHEYAPLMAWHGITTTVWLTADGAPVPMTGIEPPVTFIDPDGAAMDERGQLRPWVLENLRQLHAARPDLTNLYYGSLEGLYFQAPSGRTVYLGDEGPVSSKLLLLEAVENQIADGKARVTAIDLRTNGQAVLR